MPIKVRLILETCRHVYTCFIFTGGNRTKLPSSRWRRRGRSLREVFACSRLFATTDLSQIYNREARRHGTPCTKTTDSYPFSWNNENNSNACWNTSLIRTIRLLNISKDSKPNVWKPKTSSSNWHLNSKGAFIDSKYLALNCQILYSKEIKVFGESRSDVFGSEIMMYVRVPFETLRKENGTHPWNVKVLTTRRSHLYVICDVLTS